MPCQKRCGIYAVAVEQVQRARCRDHRTEWKQRGLALHRFGQNVYGCRFRFIRLCVHGDHLCVVALAITRATGDNDPQGSIDAANESAGLTLGRGAVEEKRRHWIAAVCERPDVKQSLASVAAGVGNNDADCCGALRATITC